MNSSTILNVPFLKQNKVNEDQWINPYSTFWDMAVDVGDDQVGLESGLDLGHRLLAIAGYDIFHHYAPALDVGGDYFKYVQLPGGRIACVVADVAGKGTSAALYMAELKGVVHSLSRRCASPRELLIEANRIIAPHLDDRSFITMTYAIADLDAGTLTAARAGHRCRHFVFGIRHIFRIEDAVLQLGIVMDHVRRDIPSDGEQRSGAVEAGDAGVGLERLLCVHQSCRGEQQ